MATNIMKMSTADAKALFDDKARYATLSDLDKLKVQKRMETMEENTSGLVASAQAVANKMKSMITGGRRRKATRKVSRKGRKATRKVSRKGRKATRRNRK